MMEAETSGYEDSSASRTLTMAINSSAESQVEDEPPVSDVVTSSMATESIKKSWGNVPASSDAPRKSFADIVAEEESAARKAEIDQARTEAEDRELMLAMQASLEHTTIADNTTGFNLEAKEQSTTTEDDEIRQAIALSLKDDNENKSSHSTEETGVAQPSALMEGRGAASMPDNSNCLSEKEVEEIERALREADEAEAVKSYELALRLQNENNATLDRLKSSNDKQQGHVRTITREEFMCQQAGLGGPQPPVSGYVDHHHHEEDGEVVGNAAGFRMNSTKTQSWQRLDRSTIVGPNNELRTKHDIELQGQANAQRLGLSVDLDDNDRFTHVGNKAFNSFKQTMKRTVKKGVAAHGTGRATADTDKTRQGGMDSNVRLQISRAINNELIEDCNGIVKEGKEAVVYHAKGGSESDGYDVAIKVFKRIQEFKQRGQYVDGDPRYLGNKFSNASSREQLEIWTEKEYRNLVRASRSNVPVPTPLLYKENILFMRFLGDDGWPSPQLREIELKIGSKKWTTLYDQTMMAIRCLYNKAKLIHADLSEYNILVCPSRLVENRYDELGLDDSDVQIVLIDFGQAVDVRHLNANEFLERDLSRIQEFFKKKGVKTMNEKDSKEYVVTWDGESDDDEEEDIVVKEEGEILLVKEKDEGDTLK